MSVSYPTRNILALRSGNRCAMPPCHRLLSQVRGDDVVMVGEAAHIAGEHGGGARGRSSPRYDPTMTEAQRNSLSNLIYVCRNCHARIDAHPHGVREYPVERLLEIKADHEKKVAAAMEEAMATVSFRELEEATQWVTEVSPPLPGQDFSRIPIRSKIQKHGLSVSLPVPYHIPSHCDAPSTFVHSNVEPRRSGFPRSADLWLPRTFLQASQGRHGFGRRSFQCDVHILAARLLRPKDPVRSRIRVGLFVRDLRSV